VLGEKATQLGDGTSDVRSALIRFTRPFNLSGHPACSVPCGFTAAGLPIGMQLVGRPFDEATVLRAADAYQRLTDWHARRPVLA
jgi:aspartyl-tRNA(Asn)/glutamyl-tRNA(Gln) amidotransferase subunit A